ncbi:MAG: hypothetical protein ACTSRD_07995 [Promethearchaeota archaeon]
MSTGFEAKRAKWRMIVIVTGIFIAFSYGLIFTIPTFHGKKLVTDSRLTDRHTSINKRYRLMVEKGRQYELKISRMDAGGIIEPKIILFSRAFKLSGVTRMPPDYYTISPHDAIIFTATHKGFYYVTLIATSEYLNDFYYTIILTEVTGDIDSPTLSYSNTAKKWLLASPAILLMPILLSASIWRIKNKHLLTVYQKSSVKNSRKKKKKCPICGVLIEKDVGYCKTCGRVFKEPSNLIS